MFVHKLIYRYVNTSCSVKRREICNFFRPWVICIHHVTVNDSTVLQPGGKVDRINRFRTHFKFTSFNNVPAVVLILTNNLNVACKMHGFPFKVIINDLNGYYCNHFFSKQAWASKCETYYSSHLTPTHELCSCKQSKI